MNVIVDILLVLIVFIGLLIGYKRGFVGIIARPVKFVATLGLSFGLSSRVASAVVMPFIEAPSANYIRDFLYRNCQNITAENASTELPTLLKIAAAAFDVDVDKVASDATGAVVDAIAERLTSPVVSVISTVISFVLLLIVLNIAISIALWLVRCIFKNGILGVFNRILGVVFGVAFFFVISWAVAVSMEFVFHLPAFSDVELIKNFEGGFVYKFLNEYNPIELLLSF